MVVRNRREVPDWWATKLVKKKLDKQVGVFWNHTCTITRNLHTHLHSGVGRSQVQFEGLHSWGRSFLSQNIRASVTALEFSILPERTIVTGQELHNYTLPQIKHLKQRQIMCIFKWMDNAAIVLLIADLPKHHKCTINSVLFIAIAWCHTYIFCSLESFYLGLPIIPIL